MDLRQLTPDLAVSGQISPDDLPAIAKAGFRLIINNRPDAEIPPGWRDVDMRAAAEQAGLQYLYLPFGHTGLTPELIEGFAQAAQGSKPVLAYCNSGNRSSILWALTQAGRRPEAEIMEIGASAGYDFSPVAPLIAALANRKA